MATTNSTPPRGIAAAMMRITGTTSPKAALTKIAEAVAAQKKLTAMRDQRMKTLTKKWEQYSYPELADIRSSDPVLYAALKADREQRRAR